MTKEEMHNSIAMTLCDKNSNLSCKECFQKGARDICKGYKHCRVSEKTEEQLEYILSSIDEDIFLRACAGSGKTEVVGMKAAYEIKKWSKFEAGGIAILTFTNDATEVIKDRISQFNIRSTTYPHLVGTLSSFIHQYIAQPYISKYTNYKGKNDDMSFSIIQNRTKTFGNHWLNSYKCEIPFITKDDKRLDLHAHQISYDKKNKQFNFVIGDITFTLKDYYKSQQMQKHIKENREKYANPSYYKFDYVNKKFKECKTHFWKDGFANFEDINLLALNVLEKNTKITKLLSRKFPLIIVDECQDLSWIEIQILKKINEHGTTLHFIGDLNQSVYEFKRVDPDDTLEFVSSFTQMILRDNFRSCQKIVDFSRKLISTVDSITAHAEDKCEDNTLLYLEYNGNFDVIEKYIKIMSELKIDQERSCIIAKQNKMKDELLCIHNKNDIDLMISALQLWDKGNAYQRLKALEYAGQQISKWLGGSKNKVSYYCPKDVNSVFMWRIFLKNVLNDCCYNSKLLDFNQNYGNWHKTARSTLPNIIKQRYSELKIFDSKMERDFDSTFSGRWYNAQNSKDIIEDVLTNINNFKIQVTTVHGSKGCTYDSTMVVSSKSKKSEAGHWESHWLNGVGEEKRVGYVASTRAKYLLVWAVPTLTENERRLIESFGLKNAKEIIGN
ncbi:ATP-dependent helicase [Desulfosporosinus sp. Sb-LF]|uniref:UvrD-helicase domain-containing protein n=1 Tax=Desulfosporosinus sp. Sb-LF TaxID=2560027 RepID=UPI00107F7AB7|nr:ATP-dependent helicase [Desulfosporosinus sp. Sb-LF]TGE33359.1 ATP-dependent helicase [Desulfosporosinus sp. Sb-LF]